MNAKQRELVEAALTAYGEAQFRCGEIGGRLDISIAQYGEMLRDMIDKLVTLRRLLGLPVPKEIARQDAP